MRRAFALLCALLCLAAALLAAGNAAFDRSGDRVYFSGDVLSGSRADAAGLSVSLRPVFDGHLYWDLAYDPSTGRLESPNGFDPDRIRYSSGAGVLETYISLGWEALFDGITPNPVYDYLYSLAGPNSEWTGATLDLSDFYDYYPVTVRDYYSLISSLDEDGLRSLNDALGDFFRIPVPSGDEVTLSIAFGENADVFSTSITYGDSYRGLNLCGPRVAGSDYLAFECSGAQGFAGFDFSHIPGGFGIYRLPYDIDLGQYAVDGLECVLPLDPLTTEDITLCPSSDGDYLLAAVRDSSGAWTLYLIEGASGRTVQAMPLFDEGEELFIEPQGDFVVFTAVSFGRSRSQSLLAAEYSPGRLEAAVRVDGGVQPALDDDTYVYETVYALDASSRRLALVNLLWTELYPPLSRPNALEIGIYSADGLEYLERVDLGLPVWDADYPRLSASFG